MTFIATEIERVGYETLIPADYNPRTMDPRTLKTLVRSLEVFGWLMPVVINRRTGNIVGGHQRARANKVLVDKFKSRGDRRAAEYSRPPAIFVDVALAKEKAMNVALNQISGDWDFFKKVAADEIRQNATFAQMTRKPYAFGRGFKAPLGLKNFDIRQASDREAFTAKYGDRILDFGAGQMQEAGWITKHTRSRVVAFEPFHRKAGKPNVAVTRRLADAMFDQLEQGWRPTTVFNNFVISSIAHREDRDNVLTILSALTGRDAQCVVAVRSVHDVCYQQVLGRVRASKGGYLGVPDVSEPGLIVTSAGTAKQKFQKFFTTDEFTALLQRFFRDVEIVQLEPDDPALVAVCRRAKRPSIARLSKALRFEFELPINKTPIGRSERALAVFKKVVAR